MSKAEVIAQDYFENKGYEVINLETNENSWQKLKPTQKHVIKSNMKEKSLLEEKGLFDLCLMSNDGETVFVEVKSKKDSIRLSQLEWPSKTKCKTFVAVVSIQEKELENVHRFSPESSKIEIEKKSGNNSGNYDFSVINKSAESQKSSLRSRKAARKVVEDPDNMREHIGELLRAKIEEQGGSLD